MRPLFFAVALVTTGLAIAACQKKSDESAAAPGTAGADAAGAAQGTDQPSDGTGVSSTSGQTAPPQPNPNGGDTSMSPASGGPTTSPEGGTTSPQGGAPGGPPPVNTPPR